MTLVETTAPSHLGTAPSANRFESVDATTRSAHRVVDADNRALRDAPTNLDPGTPTQIDFPISPGFERAIQAVITQAIDAELSFLEACTNVRFVLDKYGMVLAQGDDAGRDGDDTQV